MYVQQDWGTAEDDPLDSRLLSSLWCQCDVRVDNPLVNLFHMKKKQTMKTVEYEDGDFWISKLTLISAPEEFILKAAENLNI